MKEQKLTSISPSPGVMMIAQAFFGHDRIWSIAIFTMALTINGAVTAGYLGNGLDIAPKFSGEQNEY